MTGAEKWAQEMVEMNEMFIEGLCIAATCPPPRSDYEADRVPREGTRLPYGGPDER